MKEIGHKVEYFNLNTKKDKTNSKGYRFVILTDSDSIELFPLTIQVHSCWLQDGSTTYLYVLTFTDGGKEFYFEHDEAIFSLERLKGTEDYEYDSESKVYYKNAGQWYKYQPDKNEDILLGERIMPQIYALPANDCGYVVTQERLRGSESFSCQSYQKAVDIYGEEAVLLENMGKNEEYYIILDERHTPISHQPDHMSLSVSGQERSFYRNTDDGFWYKLAY